MYECVINLIKSVQGLYLLFGKKRMTITGIGYFYLSYFLKFI